MWTQVRNDLPLSQAPQHGLQALRPHCDVQRPAQGWWACSQKHSQNSLVAVKEMGLLLKPPHREHSQPDGFSHAFYEAFKGGITWVLCKLFFQET